MEYQKGDAVRNTKTRMEGVISDTPTDKGYVYVHWLTGWEATTKEVKHWTEFVSQDILEFIPLEGMTPGVAALHRYILR
jgi:hypothetical protein